MRDILGAALFTLAAKIMRPQMLRDVMAKVDHHCDCLYCSGETTTGGRCACAFCLHREAADK